MPKLIVYYRAVLVLLLFLPSHNHVLAITSSSSTPLSHSYLGVLVGKNEPVAKSTEKYRQSRLAPEIYYRHHMSAHIGGEWLVGLRGFRGHGKHDDQDFFTLGQQFFVQDKLSPRLKGRLGFGYQALLPKTSDNAMKILQVRNGQLGAFASCGLDFAVNADNLYFSVIVQRFQGTADSYFHGFFLAAGFFKKI